MRRRERENVETGEKRERGRGRMLEESGKGVERGERKGRGQRAMLAEGRERGWGIDRKIGRNR